ncbi:MAG: hypothetical protein AAF720_11915 [Pseudomonadota bacterium]
MRQLIASFVLIGALGFSQASAEEFNVLVTGNKATIVQSEDAAGPQDGALYYGTSFNSNFSSTQNLSSSRQFFDSDALRERLQERFQQVREQLERTRERTRDQIDDRIDQLRERLGLDPVSP